MHSRLEVMFKVHRSGPHLGKVGLLAAAQRAFGGSKFIEAVVQTYCSSNTGIRDGLKVTNNTARVPHDSRTHAHSRSLWACSTGPGRGNTASPPFKPEPCNVYQASARYCKRQPAVHCADCSMNGLGPTCITAVLRLCVLILLSCTIWPGPAPSHRRSLRHTAPDQSSSAA